MKRFLAVAISIFSVVGGYPISPASRNDLSVRLQARIDAFHKDAKPVEHPLRLVYFHPNDAPPQKGYGERITRIMLDIQSFILAEMKRNGLHERTVRLEMDGDLVKLHLVEGREGTEGYDYDFRYGQKILREMKSALKGEVDFDRDYVLVFSGLCPRTEDGVYHFRAPYYGWGGSGAKSGLCFAADCEMLDTKHFTNTVDRIRYTEHLGSFDKTLADFNFLYIGGIAHELGHGLGLPHNRQKPWERRSMGTALMGSGNFTYRKEVIGKQGSFLTKASALRLATHPMFTGSDRARFDPLKIEGLDFKFDETREGLRVRGRVKGSPEVIAVIAYSDPDGGSNYDAHTWIGEVKDGEFDLTVRVQRNGPNQLRFNYLHANGGVSSAGLPYIVAKERADASELNDAWAYARAEKAFMRGDRKEAVRLAKRELSIFSKGKYAEKLRHLAKLTRDREVVALDDVKGDSVSLSRVRWKSAEVGWGQPARDQYYSGRGIADGVCIELSGKFYAEALYAHAPARHVFEIGGKWKRFTGVGGLQLGASSAGSGVFVVKGDGRELFRSAKLGGPASVRIDVDISGVKTLELVTESGKNGNGGCWTVWGSPRLSK